MDIGRHHFPAATACGSQIPQAGFSAWLKLAAGILLIIVFIFGIGALAQHVPGARNMARTIEDNDLRPAAIYYTDFDASAEGAGRIRDSLDYPPAGLP